MTERSTTPMPECPMAETCKGMTRSAWSRTALLVPGLVFIALGIIILIEPRILAWIIAAAFVIMGIMMLIMGSYIRKAGIRFRHMH